MLYRFMRPRRRHHRQRLGYRSKEEEAQWKQRDPLARVAKEMIARRWLTAEEDAAIRNIAESAMDEVIDALTIPEGNNSKVRAELWPDLLQLRRYAFRGDLSEFRGVRFEEQESFSGKLAETKFIDAVSVS